MAAQTSPHWTEDEEVLDRYVLGRIDPATKRVLEEHLESCAQCREAVLAWRPLCVLGRNVPAAVVEARGAHAGLAQDFDQWEAEGDPIPELGLANIVLDGKGEPLCSVETTEVSVRKYNAVDSDFARAEGEGDLSLEYWREAHRNFFSRVLPKIGKEFSEEMPLVCERFRMIYK